MRAVPLRAPGPLVAVVVAALVAAACAGDDEPDAIGADAGTIEGVTVEGAFTVTEVVTGLDGPTQAVFDGADLVVAQLAGGERDATGQVLRLRRTDDGDFGSPVVVVDDLLVPTGVTVFGEDLWIMERDTLTRGPRDGSGRTVVAEGLPTNGRSEGTLTTIGDGVVYDTSGRERDGLATPGSGIVFRVGVGEESLPVATGLKHGYAHVLVDGDLFVTEIADGTFDGAVPPDELNRIPDGVPTASGPPDFGWPRCVGDRVPVVEFGATDATCESTGRPHALFAPRATPTSVVVAPWSDSTLLVALWNEGRVVTVPVEPVPERDPVHTDTTFLTGVERPQHLLVDGDRVLLVDHGGGRILAISPTG